MHIALIAKKGGVGKSTLTILLHEALQRAGKQVLVRDWDAQGTSSKVLELLGKSVASMDAAVSEPAEITILDTPPNLEHTATAVAARQADIVLVVTTPSPADLWEAEEAARFAAAQNSSAVVRVVYNKVRKSTILGRLAASGENSLEWGQALSTQLSQRECYQHALAQGWKALDSPAREEVLQLGLAVLSLGH